MNSSPYWRSGMVAARRFRARRLSRAEIPAAAAGIPTAGALAAVLSRRVGVKPPSGGKPATAYGTADGAVAGAADAGAEPALPAAEAAGAAAGLGTVGARVASGNADG